MQYNPEDATSNFEPCPLGTWPFTVADAEEKQSRNGNDMIELTLTVYPQGGDDYTIKDFLVNTPKALFKAKQFCNCVGLNFESGELNAFDCRGKSGYLIVKHEGRTYEGKDFIDGKVDEYVPKKQAEAAGKQVPLSVGDKAFDGPGDNSDLPF